MTVELHVQTIANNCPTWGTSACAAGHLVTRDFDRDIRSMPNLCLGHPYSASTKPEIVHLISERCGLPKVIMPAFALRAPLTLLLLWQHKRIQHLC